ncbi:MAG: aminotransferase class I/II-fold pyridoxal phosphate-dependent enzyme [Bacteroidales bacterium]|nr:aminotransferase class I/II-fold pyridoxal phosphate-dependent enzyme [Bacteroidales bacterium]
MIHFESDYLEGCCPQILKALQESNLEQTLGYGEDPHCARAADMIRYVFDCPDAEVHFLVGGTQTNATVIASQLRPHQGVLCAETGHIHVHETGAVESCGHKVLALPAPDGKITAAQVRRALEAHQSDFSREHMVQPGMVYISFPTELGTIYSRAELEALHAVCEEWEIPLFVDGARLGYGLEASGCDLLPKDLSRLADIFYVGGTKQGALFGEAVVFTKPALAEDFRYMIKQHGGMLAKGRLLGIQYEVLMNEGLYFQLARRADRLADRIRAAFRGKGIGFLVENTTNQVFPILTNDAVERLSAEYGVERWQAVDGTHTAVRFCTSWATAESAVAGLEAYVEKNF